VIFYCRLPGVDTGSLIYEKPYCRIAPYLVGMVLGYLLIHSKDWRLPTKVTTLLNTFSSEMVDILTSTKIVFARTLCEWCSPKTP